MTAVYARVIRHHWLLLCALTLCGGLLFGGVGRLQPPEYAARMRLEVSFVPLAERNTRLGENDLKIAQQKVKSYVAKIQDPRITVRVVRALHLDLSADELSAHVRAYSPLGGNDLIVTIVDSDPRRAVTIGRSLASEFARVAATERPSIVLGLPLVQLVGEVTPAGQVGPRWQPKAGMGLFAGFALALALGAARVRAAGRRSSPELSPADSRPAEPPSPQPPPGAPGESLVDSVSALSARRG